MRCTSVLLCLALVFFIFGIAKTGSSSDCLAVVAVGPISEETGSKFCPNGYAIRGITCSGKYCDNKTLTCCRYLNGQDNDVRGGWAPRISDEPPNNFYTNNGGWIAGIACRGNYCDNISLNFFYTGKLRNTGQCFFNLEFSEEKGYDQCPDNHFVSGLRCNGPYCDNIALYCCRGSR